MIRVANAPVSYGAFEVTLGVLPNVPGPEEVLDAIAAAGYDGTELGPPGYFGDSGVLQERLERRGLALAGAFVPILFGEPTEDLGDLDATLTLLEAAGGDARPVLADAGPRRQVDWGRFAAGVARAAERARKRGFEPTFHHHMGTAVQTPAEIERLLELTDVGLLLDTGHLRAAGGDPSDGLRGWRDRVDHVHVKDVRLEVLRRAAGWDEAWRGGVFCELGEGDVDLAAFFAELEPSGYSGWLVVEQDWVPGPDEDARGQIEAQARNRRWLSEHAGL
jgi:inosose dehydratase